MKVTMHRNPGKAAIKHNSREFVSEKDKHIDSSRSGNNYCSATYSECLTHFIEHYGSQLEAQNDRHRASRHLERIKTPEEAFQGKMKPVELVIQVGKGCDDIPDAVHRQIFNKWSEDMKTKYPRIDILQTAYHFDEASPHMQIAFYIPYEQGGKLLIGNNEKALEQMGVPLPHPGNPVDRYNNRMMTFTDEARTLLQDIAERRGFEIDRTPSERSKTHLEKEQYIAAQELQKTQQAVESLKEAHKAEIDKGVAIKASWERLTAEMSRPDTFIEQYVQEHDTMDSFRQTNFFRLGGLSMREAFREQLRNEAKKFWPEHLNNLEKQRQALKREAEEHLR